MIENLARIPFTLDFMREERRITLLRAIMPSVSLITGHFAPYIRSFGIDLFCFILIRPSRILDTVMSGLSFVFDVTAKPG